MTDEKSKPISPEVYKATQTMLMMLAQQVRMLPIEEFLAAIQHAETVGPVLDPTLFIRAGKNLDEIKRMAEGALAFQKALPQVCKLCKKKTVAYHGAVYCGAACSQRAEAREKPPDEAG